MIAWLDGSGFWVFFVVVLVVIGVADVVAHVRGWS